MSRHLGVGRFLAESLEVVEPLFALLTQLGGTWFLGAMALLLYALGDALPGWDRRRGAAVVAAFLLAVALTGFLKSALAIPRPAGADTAAYAFPGLFGEVYAWTATAEGYGVPSGHALGATAVYGTVAALVVRTRRRRAAVVAGGLITVAAFSRLALGVHLLVDVVAGVAVGLAVVGASARWAATPDRTFGIAVPAAVGWAVIAGGESAALGAAAVSLGAVLVWGRYGDRLVAASQDRPVPLAAGVLILAGIALAATEVGGPFIVAVAGFVGMAAALGLPLALENG